MSNIFYCCTSGILFYNTMEGKYEPPALSNIHALGTIVFDHRTIFKQFGGLHSTVRKTVHQGKNSKELSVFVVVTVTVHPKIRPCNAQRNAITKELQLWAFIVPVLRDHCPACFWHFPAPTNMIQMNEWMLTDLCSAWWQDCDDELKVIHSSVLGAIEQVNI